nr:hypothetical protein OG999_26780 [Streptomyces sp. NBC_00886]
MDQERTNLVNVFVSEGIARPDAEQLVEILTEAATDTACELLPGAERGDAWRWVFMAAFVLPPTIGALAEQLVPGTDALRPGHATMTARLLLGVGEGLKLRGQDQAPLPTAPTTTPALRVARWQAEAFVETELARYFPNAGQSSAVLARLAHVLREGVLEPRDDQVGGWTLLAALEALDDHVEGPPTVGHMRERHAAFQLGRALMYGIALELTATSPRPVPPPASPSPDRATGVGRLLGRFRRRP